MASGCPCGDSENDSVGIKRLRICRRQWEEGSPPPELAVSQERRATLYRCDVCGTFWEQFERYADVVSSEDARRYYQEAFMKECVVTNFSPLNSLEKALVSAKTGAMPIKEFIATLLMSDLAVPSTTEMQADGSGLTPLFFDKEGIGMLAAFTDKSRISELTNVARYCLIVKAFDLLKRMPREYGLVINPGCDVGFDISPDGIREVVKDFDRL